MAKLKLLNSLVNLIKEQPGLGRYSGFYTQSQSPLGKEPIGYDFISNKSLTSDEIKNLSEVSCETAKKVVEGVESSLGVEYVWGDEGEDGFDCSGLIYHYMQQNGVSVPRTAREQYNQSQKINKEDVKEGDLIFFHNTQKALSSGQASHVGVISKVNDNNNFDMIHASSGKDKVVLQKNVLGNSYYNNKLLGFGRVIECNNGVFSKDSDFTNDIIYSNAKNKIISGSYTAQGQKHVYDALHSFQSRKMDGFGGKINDKVEEGIKNYKKSTGIVAVDIEKVEIDIDPNTLTVNWKVTIGPSKDGNSYEEFDSRGSAGGGENNVDKQLSAMHANHLGEPKLVLYYNKNIPVCFNNDGTKKSSCGGKINIQQKFFKYKKK